MTYFISQNREMFVTVPTIQHFMLVIQISTGGLRHERVKKPNE